MTVVETPLPGVFVFQPRVFGDARGSLIETYRAEAYRPYIEEELVQDNLSSSVQGVLRGLHLQHPRGQAKLVYAVYGEVWDVCVDVRLGSPTFGRWFGVTLSAEAGSQLLIPVGFAHGFCVTSERAVVAYKCSDYYAPETQLTVAWNDPAIGIAWPITDPILSPKDAAGAGLDALRDRLPLFPKC